jgi:hypothetical protein
LCLSSARSVAEQNALEARPAASGTWFLFVGSMDSRDLPDEALYFGVWDERSSADAGQADLAIVGHLVQGRSGDRELAQRIIHAPGVGTPRRWLKDSILAGAVGLKSLQRNHLVRCSTWFDIGPTRPRLSAGKGQKRSEIN